MADAIEPSQGEKLSSDEVRELVKKHERGKMTYWDFLCAISGPAVHEFVVDENTYICCDGDWDY